MRRAMKRRYGRFMPANAKNFSRISKPGPRMCAQSWKKWQRPLSVEYVATGQTAFGLPGRALEVRNQALSLPITIAGGFEPFGTALFRRQGQLFFLNPA